MRYAKLAAALLASLLVLAFTARVSAAEGDKPKGDKAAGSDSGKKEHVVHGHIKKIDGKTLTVSVGKGDNAKDVTVQTDENTHFTMDHQACKLEDLKEGELVAVAPAEGVAKHVDVNTTHKDKNKSGGDGGKTGDHKTGDGGKAGGTGDKPKE